MKSKIIREQKGKSIISFPNDYCVVDIESTGFSPEYDEMIELSALKIENNIVVNQYSTLINIGHHLPEFITELTGITDDMLSTAPSIDSALSGFLSFIGDSVIIGHNVSFDVNFIYDNSMYIFNKPITNDFVDTMRISRKLNKDLKHHRLCDLCNFYKIDDSISHRALADCEHTNAIFQIMKNEILNTYNNYDEFINLFKYKHHHKSLNASDIVMTEDHIDPDNPLYGKVVVFTGVLEKMLRKDAMQLVVNIGGEVANGVTKKTNYLILGNNDYCSSIKDGKSSKHKKAEQLKLDGQDIEIIPENVFYDMLEM